MATAKTENNDVPGNLVRAKQLKKYLPVTERCLHYWFYQGIIPGYKVGSTIFFSPSEVLDAIKKGGQ